MHTWLSLLKGMALSFVLIFITLNTVLGAWAMRAGKSMHFGLGLAGGEIPALALTGGVTLSRSPYHSESRGLYWQSGHDNVRVPATVDA